MRALLTRHWLKSAFTRGVLAIGGGTALAQLAAVLFSPVLTRLYSPEDMGMWGLFVSYVGFASVIGSLRYEVAVVAARSEKDALELANGSLFLVVFTSFLGMLAFEVMRQRGFFGLDALPMAASFLVFFTLLFTGFGQVLRYLALRRENFSLVGRFTVLQGWVKVLLQLILAPLDTLGLLLGETFGRLAALRSLWKSTPQITVSLNLSTLLRFKAYPVFQLPSSLLNTLALVAPVPVFIALYGPAVGGALALAQRVVGLPVGLIGNAVADVFYGRASSLVRSNPGQLVGFFVGVFLRLLTIGVPLGVGMWILAPRVVPWLFGPEWALAGSMMGVMGPWMAAQLAVSPVSRLVFLSDHAWVKLVYDVFALLITLSPVWLGRKGGPEESLLQVSLGMTGLYVFYFLILLKLVYRLKTQKGGWV
ncbi:lipopolysaccharide biosynthesis protein [Thermus altitudinis]|uniref:lipopolysaccharide biosynthesis protein n=1 Tax=Thermus altitudinis TaxID=2908145 RepID=UPI00242B1339|nr:oligosaccharide flippase family protein [Thermus altitudinis]